MSPTQIEQVAKIFKESCHAEELCIQSFLQMYCWTLGLKSVTANPTGAQHESW